MGDITLHVKDNDGIVKTFVLCKRKYAEACKIHLNQISLTDYCRLQLFASWVYDQNGSNSQIDNWCVFYEIKQRYDELEKQEFNNHLSGVING